MWIRKKALEEDIDEALGVQNPEDFHHLVQQHKKINQDMVDILATPHSGSSTPVRSFNLDEESIVLWLAYEGDEISVVAWPQMSVKLLVDRAVEILNDRGVSVLFEQILLRHDGVTFDVQAVLSDYQITSDDIIEVLVSRSVRSPRVDSIIGSAPKTSHNMSSTASHDMFSALPPVSVGLTDVSLSHRNIFEDSNAHERSATQVVPGGSLFQRTLLVGQSNNGIVQDIFSEQSAGV
jgi:hypothetical protein